MTTCFYSELRVGGEYRTLHRHAHVMKTLRRPEIDHYVSIRKAIAQIEHNIQVTIPMGAVFSVLERVENRNVDGSPWYRVMYLGEAGYVNSIALAPTVEELA